MVIMDGSADQGLIVHELGHNYTMGILANNEWREGWLDEGFTSFQTTWFWETAGRTGLYEEKEATILDLDLDDYSEPPSLVAESYRDFSSYNTAIYSRGELFFHQLRYIVGQETMHRILRTFYQRWKLKHVDEAGFRAVAEEVSHRDLSTFFAQWLHSTELYDYAIGEVKAERAERAERAEKAETAEESKKAEKTERTERDVSNRSTAVPPYRRTAKWVTRVEVVRKAPGRIPVEVAVIGQRDTAVVRAEGLAEREWVTVETRSKPKQVVLDPRVRTHDWNMLNNRHRLGFSLSTVTAYPPGTEVYFHPYFGTRSRRDRMTVGLHPTVWYNDAGGVTLGIRARDDYLGRFEQGVALLSRSTGWGTDDGVGHLDFLLRARNPVFLRGPGASQTLDLFRIEGRYGITARMDWTRREHLTFGPTWSRGISLQWVALDDLRYLDRGFYDDVSTVELQVSGGVTTQSGKWQVAFQSSTGGGLAYNREGLGETGRPELDPFYFRGFVEGTARRTLSRLVAFAARGFLGVGTGHNDAAKQRQIYFQGADPLRQLNNPFLRSRGALLVGDDFHYHAPGGAGVRGIDARVSTAAIVALNLELERTLRTRPSAHLFNRVALAGFTDLSHDIGGSAQPLTGDRIRFLADAGLGIRADHRIGQTRFTTRFDFPLYVSRPELAQDRRAGDGDVEFRWTFSFEPAF
jgi:hypothetical protein